METCPATPIPPGLGTLEICVALPFPNVAQFVANFSVWAQVFSFSLVAGRGARENARCIVFCAHRIPLSYRFPGKLSILILLASLTLLACLGCFFFGCPRGVSMFCGPLASSCLSQLSTLMTTEGLGRKTTSTLLPCLYPISCVRTSLVACPGWSLLPSSLPGFLTVACTFTPDTQGRLSRSFSVDTNQSPGQDITSHPFFSRLPS